MRSTLSLPALPVFAAFPRPGGNSVLNTISIAATCAFSLVLSGFCLAGDSEARLPMWEEPSHQPVFSRGHVRVMDVFFPGGATSEFHFHEHAATYVFIQAGRVADQTYGKPWIKIPEDAIRPGDILMRTDYISDNLFHRVRNIDTTPTQIFAVVNLSAQASDPAAADVEERKGEIDNPWFRVRRVEVAPNATAAPLSVADDAILVQVRDGQSHVLIDGAASDYKGIAGGFSYHPAGTTLTVANESQDPAFFVLIEAKD
jgi:quercetin dioxygenase-like cupin family protein